MTHARPITPREAQWLCCVLETFTNTQDRKADERIRQSVWQKLSAISCGAKP